MSGYLFYGVDISNLITHGTTSAPPSYTGFPISTAPTYTSTKLDKPYNFSFQYNGNDVSNYTTAYSLAFNGGSSGSISTTIPNTPGVSFKHISGYCYGGGGGGGGGGGNINAYGGGDGGNGGDGGFAAILNYPINGESVNYQAGNRGNGGKGNTNNASGGNGNSGGSSYIYVGTTEIILANGGGGGDGGKTGGASSKGSTAASGGHGNSSFAAGYTGTTANTSPSTSYPNNPSNGGAGGNAKYDNKTNSGGSGSPGYVQVYLTYEP